MQRVTSLAACRELGVLLAFSPGICAWRMTPTWSRLPLMHRQRAGVCVRHVSPFSGEPAAHDGRLNRRRLVFAGHFHRPYCSRTGGGGPEKQSEGRLEIAVVGIPDPFTWIRCKVKIYLIKLFFGVDVKSADFVSGVKQALVHISGLLASGQYHRLTGILSQETREYVEEKCGSLTEAQRKQLAVAMEDIIFVQPKEVSVVFEPYGRKFCYVVMRFWFISEHEGPEDPEGSKIFKVTSSKDGCKQMKIVTAIYEFRQELTRGASPNWTVTNVWHWKWNAAE